MFSKYYKKERAQATVESSRGSRRVLNAQAAAWNPIICTVHKLPHSLSLSNTPSPALTLCVCVWRRLANWESGLEQVLLAKWSGGNRLASGRETARS